MATLMIMASSFAQADVYVNGYYKSNGTYVQPHYRSSPNSTTYDNWSTRGNTNPYTGQRGYKSSGYLAPAPSRPSLLAPSTVRGNTIHCDLYGNCR